MDNISLLNSILCTAFNSLMSGDRYPIIPIFRPNLVMIVDGTRTFSISGTSLRFMLQFTIGKRAVFIKGSKPSMLSSNSWLPSDC